MEILESLSSLFDFRPRVFVGRRSMCQGDDANCPNMYSFPLTRDLEELKKGLSIGLPYSTWIAYAGKRTYGPSEERGICVASKLNDIPIFSVEYACFQDAYGKNPVFKVLNKDWFWLLLKHPYLYCE